LVLILTGASGVVRFVSESCHLLISSCALSEQVGKQYDGVAGCSPRGDNAGIVFGDPLNVGELSLQPGASINSPITSSISPGNSFFRIIFDPFLLCVAQVCQQGISLRLYAFLKLDTLIVCLGEGELTSDHQRDDSAYC
jgi:hypothetical protein